METTGLALFPPLASAATGPAWELSALAVAWGLTLWWTTRWLLRREPPAGNDPAAGRVGGPQPTVRRTKPRRPTRVSSPVDTARASSTTAGAIVGTEGVMAARNPSLTYTRGLSRTSHWSHGTAANAVQG